jgi:mannose-6-phosphate isomerase class I
MSNFHSLKNDIKIDTHQLRSTSQWLIPINKEVAQNAGYDIYPTFKIDQPIYSGFSGLSKWIISQQSNIMIDGYSGVYWDIFISELNEELSKTGININWININEALKPKTEIDALIAPNMGGDDPLFGKIYEGSLIDFFDQHKLDLLKVADSGLNIIYGCGAALVGWNASVIYLDVPKNEIQFRSRSGHICNLGDDTVLTPQIQYKRFYFIDWPVLNKHKKQLLPSLDIIVDEQRINDIIWTKGQTLRNALNNMAQHMLRPRPWFEPGVWGGHWIKDNITGLNKKVVNYAWSFELIAPENGIILENDGKMLEVSFDTLLLHNSKAILGKAAKRFGDAFPIRFDFLDTVKGGNLSLQCHPTNEYTKQNFGEDFTQDETYYILDAKPGAEVYLGFQENIDKDEFKAVLENSFDNKTRVKIDDYIQVFPANKHDLFLIPNGTVHCSGKDNMVLEISATPYIFTFKMYDWLRPDLNGNPRTLNINRAFDNLNFAYKGNVVTDTLISKQTIKQQGADWQIINLTTHPDHFYAIERFEFDTIFEQQTNNQCHVLSLVEGESIIVKTGNIEQVIHYAETFIVPANALTYTVINTGKSRAKVIKAFVKDECC